MDQTQLLQGIYDVLKEQSDNEKNAYSKDNLLKREVEVTQGLIIQKEVEIEAAWKTLNATQKSKEKLLKEVVENNEKMREIKSATPMPEGWQDQIKELIGRNVVLGETTEKAKNGDKIYRGEILKADREIEHYRNEISSGVGKREFYKTKLQALLEMQKNGYTDDFDKLQNEMVEQDASLMPVQ